MSEDRSKPDFPTGTATDNAARYVLENRIYKDNPETPHLLLQDHSTGCKGRKLDCEW